MKSGFFHVPVLVDEVLKSFENVTLSIFLDGTLGLGNHARQLLTSHPEIERYIGIDQDESALQIAKNSLSEWRTKTKFYHDNFENFDRILKRENIDQVDGFLFDLGASSMQLDDPERGFSFRTSSPLDMRMDRSKKITAEQIINQFNENDLERIFKDFGEEPSFKKIARAIIERRRTKKITTTKELADLICQIKGSKKKIHPATLVFQALRIYINDELGVLERGLSKAITRLKPGGRIAVISFHSLEDRIVKDLFKSVSKKEHVNPYKAVQKTRGMLLINKKPITPSINEIKKNPRSRSAKMRVLEKSYE